MNYDVVVVGGGPSGSTFASLLRKYAPEVSVLVVEREVFPREHVGESQLPPITAVLDEMGVWHKVEAAGFPVKTGALYRWGSSDDLWRFDFLVGETYEELPRPQPLVGQRRRTTFHVERGTYDKILLDHCKELGVEVLEGVRALKVDRSGDRIDALYLDNGLRTTAKHYIDASGHVGILRRLMEVETEEPTSLKNVAFWDYWENEAWGETVNKGGVRARIFSVGYGWIWFIPLSSTRTSIGFVTHAEYYKKSGIRGEELYLKALLDEPFVTSILPGAVRENKLRSTKDWSFTAKRLYGENWFLVGESAGFADPILAAGMTLAQVGARELAYVVGALLKGEHEPEWLRSWYQMLNLRRVRQHIRFADFWYSANTHFSELKEYTSKIAQEAGLTLKPDLAFRWLAAGGFSTDHLGLPGVGSYSIGPAKILMQILTGEESQWHLNRFNEFRLNLVGALKTEVPDFVAGRIERVQCYQREARLLPLNGIYKIWVDLLQRERDARTLGQQIQQIVATTGDSNRDQRNMATAIEALEGMITEGWVTAKYNKERPLLRIRIEEDSMVITHEHEPEAYLAYARVRDLIDAENEETLSI